MPLYSLKSIEAAKFVPSKPTADVVTKAPNIIPDTEGGSLFTPMIFDSTSCRWRHSPAGRCGSSSIENENTDTQNSNGA